MFVNRFHICFALPQILFLAVTQKNVIVNSDVVLAVTQMFFIVNSVFFLAVTQMFLSLIQMLF